MNGNSLIELNQVTKLYGTVIGVNDFTMELKPGAYGLLGPNGAGKSTLLNLLIGQLIPTRGMVRVMGEDPRNNPGLIRRIGFCPGFEGLYADTRGLDWVVLLLQLHGIRRTAAVARAIACMELVGMADHMNRSISSYSRGMRQRTKLAQALAHEPEILILDEPFSGLDPLGRAEMTTVLRDWIALGKSVIIASHVLHEIESLTNSFLLICGGRLLASGSAAEVHRLLFNNPSDVEIHCDQPHQLAGLLMQRELVTSVGIEKTPSGVEALKVRTLNPAELCAQLPELISDHRMHVSRVRSSDDSLQALFNSLMKMHRGEL